MKKAANHIFIVISIFVVGPLYSQKNISGFVIYKQSLSLSDSSKITSTKMRLIFTQKASLYIEDETLKKLLIDSASNKNYSLTKYSSEIYKNHINSQIWSRSLAFIERVIVKDTLKSIGWVIKNEIKFISNIKCQKAEAFIRGRHYVAWFAPEIPINDGPWKIYGLPGLILEAIDVKNKVRFELEELSLKDNGLGVFIKPPQPFGKISVVLSESFPLRAKKNKENFLKQMRSDPQFADGETNIKTNSIEIFPEK